MNFLYSKLSLAAIINSDGFDLGPCVPRCAWLLRGTVLGPPPLRASPSPHPGAGRLERGGEGSACEAPAAGSLVLLGCLSPRSLPAQTALRNLAGAQCQRPCRSGRPAHRGSRPTPPAPPAHAEFSIIIIKESLRTCLH